MTSCAEEIWTESSTEQGRAKANALGFDERQSFERFVVGSSNQFTSSAAQNVAAKPGTAYNPLFVHGPTGLGKTHLLRAIGRRILENDVTKTVVYVTSETVINEFVTCVFRKNMPAFREKYRQCDVLLIDDVQYLAPQHEKTQVELFHVFNALHSDKRQIVLTADVPPAELHGLEGRLRSRFEWGLSVDVRPPDVEDRAAILAAKARDAGLPLDIEVQRFVAERCPDTVRQLEGVLSLLLARWRIEGGSLTIERVRQILPERRRKVSNDQDVIRLLQKRIAAEFGVDVPGLLGKSRSRELVSARQAAMFLCRRNCKAPYVEIGRRFGGRDHTTVIHACQKIAAEIANDVDLRLRLEAAERGLQ